MIDMRLRYLYLAFLGMMVASDVMAINLVDSNTYTKWMSTVGKKTFGDASEGAFIVAGALGKGKSPGTWNDESAIVAVVAVEIVEHGGYFCPLQIQCANSDTKKHKKSSWTNYYHPSGYSADKCAWLCETGYVGQKCAKQTSYLPQSNILDLTSGVSVKKKGKNVGEISDQIFGFDAWDYGDYSKDVSKNEKNVLLGAVSFQEHGVMATPVSIECDKDGKKSFVNKVAAYSDLTQKLLCAEGYAANQHNTECVPMTVEMLNLTTQVSDQKKMCSGWTEEGYNSAIHNIDATGDCVKYICKDSTKAFPEYGSFECAECAGSIRGGQHPVTGLCVQCDGAGQYFDTKTGDCKSANAFTRIDMLYGKGKSKETNPKVDAQCWTKVNPEEYRNCVTNGYKMSVKKLVNVKLVESIGTLTWPPTGDSTKTENSTTTGNAQSGGTGTQNLGQGTGTQNNYNAANLDLLNLQQSPGLEQLRDTVFY